MTGASQHHQNLPKHLAFIMDGNGRWATKRGLRRVAGHQRGVHAAKNVVKAALKYGVPYVTLYAFSTENFNRPADEVSFLMRLFSKGIRKYAKFFVGNGIKFTAIGDMDKLPNELQCAIESLRANTANFTRLTVTVAVNYGARDEIVSAVRAIVREGISHADIGWETIVQHLHTRDLPEPDMLIRTSGEKRLSNFLLMQMAYTELHFVDKYWPDVDEGTFVDILHEYGRRIRRIGRIGQ
jgi:undecaprenyl diphosphate synthase